MDARMLGLLAAGVSMVSASAACSVSRSSARRWARLWGVEMRDAPEPGAAYVPSPVAVTGPVDAAGHLTFVGRATIQQSLSRREPPTQAAIARSLGVHPSTVCNELRRPRDAEGRYSAVVAQRHADASAKRPKPRKLDQARLRERVVGLLDERCSPEQVAGRLRREHPDDQDMQVSHETIYQALYLTGRGALRHELTVAKALRSGRTGRKPQSKLTRSSRKPWIDGHHISTRPAEAADRAVPGHWEGDLVIGADHASALVSLVERTSRFTLIRRLPFTHDSATVTEVVAAAIRDLPDALRRSLTWDQGSEMAQHASITITTGTRVFFCDPHSPWQRPSNENTNGLIREFYPKGTDFTAVTDDDIVETQRLLNIRPRAILDFATPAERLDELLGIATTG